MKVARRLETLRRQSSDRFDLRRALVEPLPKVYRRLRNTSPVSSGQRVTRNGQLLRYLSH